MKSQEEITKAHDTLRAILLEEVPIKVVMPEIISEIHAIMDVFCWILGHEHNTTFQKNLDRIEGALKKLGYSYEKKSLRSHFSGPPKLN